MNSINAFDLQLPKTRKAGKQSFLATTLRDEIVQGKLPAGSQLSSHLVLAKRFGVSVVTVQLGLNRLAREGFVESRPRRGTFVTTKLPHLTNYALVFWNDPLYPLEWSKYYAAITNAARGIEREDGCKLSLFHGVDHPDSEDRLRLASLVKSHRVAGIVFVNNPASLDGTPVLCEPGVPRVALMDQQLYPHIPVVSFDSSPSLFERALDYLCERGRKRIAMVDIGSDEKWEPHAQAALEARGLTIPNYWRQMASNTHPNRARNCVELLMRAPAGERPDGLIIADDNFVEHGLAGLVAAGVRVPDDVEVVVHCNFPWPAASVLPVKRLGFDIRQVLRTCINLIDRQRRGEAVPGCTSVPAIFEEELKPLSLPASASKETIQTTEKPRRFRAARA